MYFQKNGYFRSNLENVPPNIPPKYAQKLVFNKESNEHFLSPMN